MVVTTHQKVDLDNGVYASRLHEGTQIALAAGAGTNVEEVRPRRRGERGAHGHIAIRNSARLATQVQARGHQTITRAVILNGHGRAVKLDVVVCFIGRPAELSARHI